MTSRRSPRCALLALLLGAWLVSLSGCSGRALILDGAPPSTVSTADAGAVETLPLPDEIVEFWVDDVRLYWATADRRVRSCLHDDCEHTSLTYGSAYSLILNDPNVFWADAAPGALATCPKAGCSGTPILLINDPYMKGATGDGDYVYWSSAFDTYRCPSSGCGDDIPQVVVRSESTPDLRFAGSRAYWSRYGGLVDGGNVMEIRSAPKDGSESPTTVLTITGDASVDFAVDTTNLYWIDDSFQVQSCPLDRCRSQPPTPLVTSDHEKYGLKVDASGLYWYERSENPRFVIGFCPLSGCGSEPRAVTDALAGSGPAIPYGLDSTYVYWQERAANGALDAKSIHRMRKPTP